MQTKPAGKRIEYMDFARGLVMFLVVYHHTVLVPEIVGVFYRPFFMPFFFFVSGFFYSQKPAKEFLKGKAVSLLLPFVIWRTVYSLIEAAYTFYSSGISAETALENVKNYFLGLLAYRSPMLSGPTWFFICLFVINILYRCVDTVCKKKAVKYAVLIIILAAGIAFNELFEIDLPFKFINAVIELPVFFLGTMLKEECRKEGKFWKLIMKPFMLPAFLLLFGSLAFLHYILFDSVISVTNNQYNNYPLFYINAVLGSLLIINLSYQVIRIGQNKVFNLIIAGGVYSGVLLCLHNALDGAVKTPFKLLPIYESFKYGFAVLIAVIVFVVLALFAKAISKMDMIKIFGCKPQKN